MPVRIHPLPSIPQEIASEVVGPLPSRSWASRFIGLCCCRPADRVVHHSILKRDGNGLSLTDKRGVVRMGALRHKKISKLSKGELHQVALDLSGQQIVCLTKDQVSWLNEQELKSMIWQIKPQQIPSIDPQALEGVIHRCSKQQIRHVSINQLSKVMKSIGPEKVPLLSIGQVNAVFNGMSKSHLRSLSADQIRGLSFRQWDIVQRAR